MGYGSTLATVDRRPFFERALTYGVQQGLIDPIKCEAIIADGAKGTVQVADYFGTSHLFTSLDDARKRIVHLVSLCLQDRFGDDLAQAARSLQENSFLSHSRGGNELLKNLHAMPESSVFDSGFGGRSGQSLKEFQDERTLAKPLGHAAYRKELQRREGNAASQAAARWFAQDMKVPMSALDSVAAEAVVRTALLLRVAGADDAPGRQEFAALLMTLRNRIGATKFKLPKDLLADVPEAHVSFAATVQRDIQKHDVALLVDTSVAMDLVYNTLETRYFLRETGLEDIDAFDAFVSKEWQALTRGKEDPDSRQTVFMCVAAGVKPKPALTPTEARALIRSARKNGLDRAAVSDLISTSAPFSVRESLATMWETELFPEAQIALFDKTDDKLIYAMHFLAENCNVTKK